MSIRGLATFSPANSPSIHRRSIPTQRRGRMPLTKETLFLQRGDFFPYGTLRRLPRIDRDPETAADFNRGTQSLTVGASL